MGDMKGRLLLEGRDGQLGEAHELDGVGCLHEEATSSIRRDADLHRHQLSQGKQLSAFHVAHYA